MAVGFSFAVGTLAGKVTKASMLAYYAVTEKSSESDGCYVCYTGHGSVKGLRVKVFRPDSKPQWLHGIVSHHDHTSRTMTVLTDQVGKHLACRFLW